MSFSRIKVKQIEEGQLYDFFKDRFVTGDIVRPSETGIFSTAEDLNSLAVITSGSMANLSGQLYQTGQYLVTGYLQNLESNLSGALQTTGQDCLNLINALSGTINQSGLILSNRITGLSGAFNRTGAILEERFPSFSGALDATGLNLIKTITGLSGAFDISGLALVNLINDLSGTFNRTGLNLINSINNLSGSLNATGQYLLTQITGNPLIFQTGQTLWNTIESLSGTFDLTGRNLELSIDSLSGTLNSTGLTLARWMTGLSGAFDRTGLNLIKTITGLSGAFDISGRNLQNDVDAFRNNFTTINGLSGLVIITGSGNIITSQLGQNIYIYGETGSLNPAKVVSVNDLTGLIFISGVSGVMVNNLADNVIGISTQFINDGQTGVFVTTGDLYNLSGFFTGIIQTGSAGVSSINGLTGVVTLSAGDGISISASGKNILISGQNVNGLPTWVTNSPDINPVVTQFDDDFNGTTLDPKWTVTVGRSLESSGISNSYFYVQPAAHATESLVTFTQDVVTGLEWDLTMKCNVLPSFVNNQAAGLVYKNKFSSRVSLFGFYYTNAVYSSLVQYTTYTSTSSAQFTSGAFPAFSSFYLRVQRRNFLFNYDLSTDGVFWRNIRANYADTFITGGINQMGFAANSDGAVVGLSVDWIKISGCS